MLRKLGNVLIDGGACAFCIGLGVRLIAFGLSFVCTDNVKKEPTDGNN